MGYSTHSVDNLGSPFWLVDETVFVVPRGGRLRLRQHHFKVLFLLGGEIEHEIEGLEGRRALGAGDILVAPVVAHHSYINPDQRRAVPVQAIRMFLDSELLAARAGRRIRKPEADLADFVLHHFPRVVQLRGGIDNEITGLIREFRRETESTRLGFRHRVRAICTELIVAVARKLGAGVAGVPACGSGPGVGAQIVNAAKEYILKHAAEDISLGEVAWHVGKGEEHLARVFKRETGQSVFDYVREIRVNEAKTLLLNPALNLTQIAGRCGFHSLAYFSRTFRQQAGVSPSQYRRHNESLLAQGPTRKRKPETRLGGSLGRRSGF